MRNGLLIVPILFLLVGCTTYYNYPPQPGDLAVPNPEDGTAVDVQASAVSAAVVDRPLGARANLALPPGTGALSRAKVLAAAGDALYADQHPDAPTIEVRQVRIRGRLAEVDIVRPASVGGPLQLVTVYLNWEPIAGWQSSRLRYWRVPVEEALRKSAGEVEAATPQESADDPSVPEPEPTP